MTATTTRIAKTAAIAQTRDDRAVAAALRDVAYVLQLTRKVKAEIVGTTPAAIRPQAATNEVLSAVSA